MKTNCIYSSQWLEWFMELMFLYLTGWPSDYNFHTQSSDHPVNFTLVRIFHRNQRLNPGCTESRRALLLRHQLQFRLIWTIGLGACGYHSQWQPAVPDCFELTVGRMNWSLWVKGGVRKAASQARKQLNHVKHLNHLWTMRSRVGRESTSEARGAPSKVVRELDKVNDDIWSSLWSLFRKWNVRPASRLFIRIR